MMAYRSFVAAAILSIASSFTAGVIDFATLVGGDDPDGHKARTAYEELKKSKQPVFVFWHLHGCPPCKKVTPVIEALAQEFQNKVRFVSIQVPRFEKLANRIGEIQYFPTLLIIRGGDVVWIESGYKDKDLLRKTIKEKAGVS